MLQTCSEKIPERLSKLLNTTAEQTYCPLTGFSLVASARDYSRSKIANFRVDGMT